MSARLVSAVETWDFKKVTIITITIIIIIIIII